MKPIPRSASAPSKGIPDCERLGRVLVSACPNIQMGVPCFDCLCMCVSRVEEETTPESIQSFSFANFFEGNISAETKCCEILKWYPNSFAESFQPHIKHSSQLTFIGCSLCAGANRLTNTPFTNINTNLPNTNTNTNTNTP